jgi:hypothetical protein
MDDNFRSIVKAVLWGRSVFQNIRKFLMFQVSCLACSASVHPTPGVNAQQSGVRSTQTF